MGRSYANVAWLGLDADQWWIELKSMTQLTCFNGLWVKPCTSLPAKRLFLLVVKWNGALLSNPTTPNSSCSNSLFHYDLFPVWPSLAHRGITQVRKLWARGISTNLQAHLHRTRDSQEEVVDRAAVWQVNKSPSWCMFWYRSANQCEHPAFGGMSSLFTRFSFTIYVFGHIMWQKLTEANRKWNIHIKNNQGSFLACGIFLILFWTYNGYKSHYLQPIIIYKLHTQYIAASSLTNNKTFVSFISYGGLANMTHSSHPGRSLSQSDLRNKTNCCVDLMNPHHFSVHYTTLQCSWQLWLTLQ